MFRITLSAVLFAAITALAAGQNSPLLASEQLKLLKSNRLLLDDLVSRSLQLSKANNSLDRAVACHTVVGDISRSLTTAIAAEDSPRVAELSDYLTQVVRQGLVPTLVAAYAIEPTMSEGYVKLQNLNETAAEDVGRAELSIPQLGKLGKSVLVKDAREMLKGAKGQLDALKKPLVAPKQ